MDFIDLIEVRRRATLGHDWTPELEDLYRLAQALYELPRLPGGRIRAITSHEGGVYVFREWYPAGDRRAVRIQYFHDGNWHETVEGALFSALKPFLVREPELALEEDEEEAD